MKFLTEYFSNRRREKQKKQYMEKYQYHRTSYLINETTPFCVTEAFRKLKVSVSVGLPKKENGKGTSILLTSNYPEDGKTTVAVNLALMFAMSDVKVLLVDADIRKGRISKYFNEHHTPGLSDCISGQATLDRVIHQTEQNKNLSVIYQGTQSPRPFELLESDAMKKLSEELSSKFDYIIYDTPPIKLVSDALALVPVTDGAVLVCRHMITYESDIKSSLDTLRFSKANVLGIVVNGYYSKSKGNKNTRIYKNYAYSYTDSDPESPFPKN